MRRSVAMTGDLAEQLRTQLLRSDGQEDVCLATYRLSSGAERQTALLRTIECPQDGERAVHGNAAFTGDYVLRVSSIAATDECGVAILHSHPQARGWQAMSPADADAERSFAFLVQALTGLPLVGLTLAGGDGRWSARIWDRSGGAAWCESVRVVGDVLRVSWNDDLRLAPAVENSQLRTVSGWGSAVQADLARLAVLVVGPGSVGLDVALRLAASGIEHVAVMDFDTVETVNLDRLIGASALDAKLARSKVDIARRLLTRTATARRPDIRTYDLSVCEPDGHRSALDYDIIFSCVDRPWARAVLNALAYTDLIPVLDGGLHIDVFADGGGMRNATWRSHIVRPGRACLACNGQLELGQVAADRTGLLDDPEYIRGAAPSVVPVRQNVAALSIGLAAGLLAQFVSFVAAPGDRGDPGPLQFLLSTHTLAHLDRTTVAGSTSQVPTPSPRWREPDVADCNGGLVCAPCVGSMTPLRPSAEWRLTACLRSTSDYLAGSRRSVVRDHARVCELLLVAAGRQNSNTHKGRRVTCARPRDRVTSPVGARGPRPTLGVVAWVYRRCTRVTRTQEIRAKPVDCVDGSPLIRGHGVDQGALERPQRRSSSLPRTWQSTGWASYWAATARRRPPKAAQGGGQVRGEPSVAEIGASGRNGASWTPSHGSRRAFSGARTGHQNARARCARTVLRGRAPRVSFAWYPTRRSDIAAQAANSRTSALESRLACPSAARSRTPVLFASNVSRRGAWRLR